MKVGLILPQTGTEGARAWPGIVSLARQAEHGGADSLWICDHFFYRPTDGTETGYHEVWTLLAGLAVATTRVELGTLVLATSFRSPGLLAKMAATADDISNGRLILGLGCGWHEPEYRAFGYPFDHRVGRFEEALQVIVPLLDGERVTLDGRWTSAEDAVVLPRPRRPRLPVLIASEGERMLRLTARHADAWNAAWFGPPSEGFTLLRTRLEAACVAEGRDPATIDVTVGLNVGDPDEGESGRYLALDPEAVADGLGAWASLGVAHVQLGIQPETEASFDVVLEGIRRFRGGGMGEPAPT